MSKIIQDFVDEVVAKAKELGIDMAVIANGKLGHSGEIENVTKPYSYPVIKITLRDLFEFMQTTVTDDTGMIELFPGQISNTPGVIYQGLFYGAQIYSTRTQINIVRGGDYLDTLSIANFVFTDDTEVQLVNVDACGRADYDNPTWLPMDTPISDIDWEAIFGENARLVSKIVVDMLVLWRTNDKKIDLNQETSINVVHYTFMDLLEVLTKCTQPDQFYSFNDCWVVYHERYNEEKNSQGYVLYNRLYGSKSAYRVARFDYYSVDGELCCEIETYLGDNHTPAPQDAPFLVKASAPMDGPVSSPFSWAGHIGRTFGENIQNTLWRLLEDNK